MKFRKGQTVYYFEKTGPFQGAICEGGVKSASKDLMTGKITYVVSSTVTFLGYSICEHTRDITLDEDQLYKSRKQLEKDYKEFLLYGNLSAKIDTLDDLLSEVKKLLEPKEAQQVFGDGLTVNVKGLDKNTISFASNNLVVDGIGDLQEEFNKLKKEVSDIKKKIKKPTKKPVIKEKKEKEVVGI